LDGRAKIPKIERGSLDSYKALIRQNIDYYDLLQGEPSNQDILDGYVELMVEVCCGQGECVRINDENMPRKVVKSRFLKLNREHINYVKESLQKNTTNIKNIKAYTLTALYNAPTTLSQYYISEISRDMAAGYI